MGCSTRGLSAGLTQMVDWRAACGRGPSSVRQSDICLSSLRIISALIALSRTISPFSSRSQS
jgi:hypothetical protein